MTEEQTLPEKAAESGSNRLREIWRSLMRGMSGFNPWQPVHQRHTRRYTKAYADGRQKQGGALWYSQRARLRREPALPHFAAPAPSAKAVARQAQTQLVRALLKTKRWKPGDGWKVWR